MREHICGYRIDTLFGVQIRPTTDILRVNSGEKITSFSEYEKQFKPEAGERAVSDDDCKRSGEQYE